MEFRERQAIYMQIADYFSSHILQQKWLPDEKVPSIRQLAIKLEVNPNTVSRSYTYLQESGIIYNKRGIGYFVSTSAKQILLDTKRRRFVEKELPELFKNMILLEFNTEEIEKLFVEWKEKMSNFKNINNEKNK